MAEKDFDFNALKELKLVKYAKEYCKPTIVKKSKAALIFLDYKMAGKKTPCIIVPFKKYAEAAKAFKAAKLGKEHLIKKTGLAELTIAKGADGKEEITVNLKKGGISPEMLIAKGQDLFESTIKMTLKVMGQAEDAEEEQETEAATEKNKDVASNTTKTEVAPKKDVKQDAQKLDRATKIAQIKANVDKMLALVGKTPKEKLEPNILKYEVALEKISSSTIDKEEQATLNSVQTALETLKKKIEEAKATPVPTEGRKLTTEQKLKIKENMAKVNARLEALVKKLGL